MTENFAAEAAVHACANRSSAMWPQPARRDVHPDDDRVELTRAYADGRADCHQARRIWSPWGFSSSTLPILHEDLARKKGRGPGWNDDDDAVETAAGDVSEPVAVR
jgi:hypothetical protein